MSALIFAEAPAGIDPRALSHHANAHSVPWHIPHSTWCLKATSLKTQKESALQGVFNFRLDQCTPYLEHAYTLVVVHTDCALRAARLTVFSEVKQLGKRYSAATQAVLDCYKVLQGARS